MARECGRTTRPSGAGPRSGAARRQGGSPGLVGRGRARGARRRDAACRGRGTPRRRLEIGRRARGRAAWRGPRGAAEVARRARRAPSSQAATWAARREAGRSRGSCPRASPRPGPSMCDLTRCAGRGPRSAGGCTGLRVPSRTRTVAASRARRASVGRACAGRVVVEVEADVRRLAHSTSTRSSAGKGCRAGRAACRAPRRTPRGRCGCVLRARPVGGDLLRPGRRLGVEVVEAVKVRAAKKLSRTYRMARSTRPFSLPRAGATGRGSKR